MKVPAPASHKQEQLLSDMIFLQHYLVPILKNNNEASGVGKVLGQFLRCDGHLLESVLPQASFLGQGTKEVLVGVS